ncbi:hypothetical protein HYC85_027995 [Camellia sinensis]|uniref:Uncharacterized protein n=1 Tax=Camellia sinensis TaxID=4442 RepID=A0A7J7FXY1_CAMSI|nr:hypothetical protein HYC85_027995 [Camellia sinensis]
MESGMVAIRDRDDGVNCVVAGLGDWGGLYGGRGGEVGGGAAAIGGVVVGMAVAGKQLVKRYVPI